MSEYCNDCKLPVSPCGWGAEDCNNSATAVGIINIEAARHILGLPENLEHMVSPEDLPDDE
jgi:hypothetical protein